MSLAGVYQERPGTRGGHGAGGQDDYTYMEYASGEHTVWRHVGIVSWAYVFTAFPGFPAFCEPLPAARSHIGVATADMRAVGAHVITLES